MNKTVIITGASGNLGKVAMEKFLASGYFVIATVTPGRALGFEVQGEHEVYEVDLTNEEEVKEFVQKSIASHGEFHAVLCLVGGFSLGTINETDTALLQKMINLNFNTTYNVAKPVFHQMMNQKDGGKIILIGARPSISPAEGKEMVAYALSKSLVFRLAEIFNAEGASSSVVSHVIIPSTMDTPANRKSNPDADFSAWVKPEDIAEMMLYLCSESGKPIREGVIKVYGRS